MGGAFSGEGCLSSLTHPSDVNSSLNCAAGDPALGSRPRFFEDDVSDNTPTLADYARRMRALVEEDVRIAADLRELAKEMRECGHRPVVIKAIVKALVLAEDYDNPKPLEALKERAQDVAMYGAALGIEIDGFGEREPKRNGVKDSDGRGAAMVDAWAPRETPHDADGVVIEPAAAVVTTPEPQNTAAVEPETAPVVTTPAAVPVPVQSHIVREPAPSRELGVTEDIPAFLRRTMKPAEAAE